MNFSAKLIRLAQNLIFLIQGYEIKYIISSVNLTVLKFDSRVKRYNTNIKH